MNKKFILALIPIIYMAGCCQHRTIDFNEQTTSIKKDDYHTQVSRNDFKIYAKDIHSIYFRFNSASIQNESIPKINHLISQLKKVRNIKLIMHGYTDRVGMDHYNHQLAIRRINEIKKLLIHSGVTKANNISIETKALGKNDPLISYNTINNNPRSRRVDVFITRH